MCSAQHLAIVALAGGDAGRVRRDSSSGVVVGVGGAGEAVEDRQAQARGAERAHVDGVAAGRVQGRASRRRGGRRPGRGRSRCRGATISIRSRRSARSGASSSTSSDADASAAFESRARRLDVRRAASRRARRSAGTARRAASSASPSGPARPSGRPRRAAAGPADRAPTRASASASGVVAPGRSSAPRRPSTATTVDSMPCGAGPPSRIRSTRSPRSSTTCSAVVALVRVNRLALGAAIGTPAARISAWATGWLGTRTATVGRPAVATSGTTGRFGRTSVSGPGQNRSARARAIGGTSATTVARSSSEARWTISGSSRARRLAAKIERTAASSRALAPRP